MTPAGAGVDVSVYRAPMRSRRDDVDHAAAVRRALRLGLCGVGGRLDRPPADLAAAIAAVAATYDERTAARLERFTAVPEGAFVWTMDGDGGFFLGRVTGPWRYDPALAAHAVDLVHVRGCDWLEDPVLPRRAPPAVAQTFARGGRNVQRIRHPEAAAQTQAVWQDRLRPRRSAR